MKVNCKNCGKETFVFPWDEHLCGYCRDAMLDGKIKEETGGQVMNRQIDELAKRICRADCGVKSKNLTCCNRCKAYIYAKRAIESGYVHISAAERIAREMKEG